MRNNLFILSIVVFLGLSSCGTNTKKTDAGLIDNSSTASDPNSKSKEPIMTFEKETHDFGTLNEGDVVEHFYYFTNTGNKPLMISDVQASCGCTVPEWPREPILAGQKNQIKIVFNTARKADNIMKDITIYSNANPIKKKLSFTAYVIKKAEK